MFHELLLFDFSCVQQNLAEVHCVDTVLAMESQKYLQRQVGSSPMLLFLLPVFKILFKCFVLFF